MKQLFVVEAGEHKDVLLTNLAELLQRVELLVTGHLRHRSVFNTLEASTSKHKAAI